jgi:hypothetical protein
VEGGIGEFAVRPLWVESSHHAATALVAPFWPDATSVNDRFS